MLRFFGIHACQNEDYTITTDVKDKLGVLNGYSISRHRRHQVTETLNDVEKSSFLSTNNSFGWIYTAASPLCSIYSRYLQQKAQKINVFHIGEAINVLRKLKKSEQKLNI